MPLPSIPRNEGCLFTQQLSVLLTVVVRKRFFSPENIFRHGKVMNAPRERAKREPYLKWVWWFALSMLSSSFPTLLWKRYLRKAGKRRKKAMTWPPDWLLILGTQERRSWRGTKNSMETGESCSGNDVSIWWLMERYDVFGIADLMVRHLRRSRVDTVFVHHPSRLWSSFFSSRNIVQLSSSSKCNFRTLEGANDLGHFDTTDVSKVSKGGI